MRRFGGLGLSLLPVLLIGVTPASGQGLVFPGAGPINLSMAGASTAAAIDVGGSYWNPAIISGLSRNEFLIGSQFSLPSIHLQSILPAGSIGGQFPPTNRFGTSRSDGGVGAIPTGILSFRMSDDSPWTFALGSQYLVGGAVNFPSSRATPITSPHAPPKFFGAGPIFGSLTVGVSSLIASRQVTDRLAIAGGPLVAVETLNADPASFAPPIQPILSGGYPTFPSAFHQRPFWGAGFQLGLYYEMNDNWNLGFSYKSPIWQERWGFNAATPSGGPNRIGVQAGLPEIFSWGVAYKGLPKTLIDLDLRYLDYANTALFGDAAPPQGTGLGWRSVFAMALGGQYKATDKLTLRMGYLYNTNPIPSARTLLNVQLPAIIQNTLALGTSYQLTEDITISLAYNHSFRNAITGRIAQAPGTSIREDVQVDSIVAGLNVQFGRPRSRRGLTDVVTTAPAPAVPAVCPDCEPEVPAPAAPPASAEIR